MGRDVRSPGVNSKLTRTASRNCISVGFNVGEDVEVCCAGNILKCIIVKEVYGCIIANTA